MPQPNESSSPYAPGDIIAAKYRLERLLGEGGMGAVWAAHNIALDSSVAIKLIRGDTDREALSVRLQLEARAAARLGHPAIVRVFDIGDTARGDPFIVMELLEGESLAAKLDREARISAIEAAQVLLPIADALRAAHSKGIVHRDIKPDNVFLSTEGEAVQPKLVDFGIAKLEQSSGGSQLTQHGVVVGSPDYMSPEQARGDDVIDYRTDVWAFSVLLYECVTGRLPFDAHNYNALLRSIVEDRPATLVDLAAADAELSHIVEVGMAKDRNERWRSMHELGIALAAWLKHQGVLEDTTGASLDTKWLNRKSDPAGRLSRPSMGSAPDGLFSPASGVAVTVRAPRAIDSTTPSSVPTSTTSGKVIPLTRRPIAIVVAAGVALGLLLAYALTRTAGAPPEQAVRPPTEREPAASLPPAPVVTPVPSPTAQAEKAPTVVSGAGTAPSAHSVRPERGRAVAPHKKSAPEGSARPPSSDLIAPY